MGHRSHGKTDELSENVLTQGRGLWTRNAVPGVRVRGEGLRRIRGAEWRSWSPRHSKLGAGILRTKAERASLLPKLGSQVLYLGAGHGTTISYLHDHMCGEGNYLGGSIISVDVAPRCIRDLVSLAKKRPGILPVLADARQPDTLRPWLNGRVDWLFQDVSQSGQVDFFLTAARNFLSPSGQALLSLKSASEPNVEGGSEEHYAAAVDAMVASGIEVIEVIRLKGWEDQHALIVGKAPRKWP